MLTELVEYHGKMEKKVKAMKSEKEDGRGVNGNHTDLLPRPIWNYNSVVEKPPGTNN